MGGGAATRRSGERSKSSLSPKNGVIASMEGGKGLHLAKEKGNGRFDLMSEKEGRAEIPNHNSPRKKKIRLFVQIAKK